METARLLFEILRSEVNGELLPADRCRGYDPQQLYTLAKSHDLMYCVTDALDKVGLLPEAESARAAYVKEQMLAVARTARIESVLATVKEVLSVAAIPFVPLKGSLLRYMYPDKMMRTSCDIDVLVREEDLDRAVSALTDAGFVTEGARNYHDVSLFFGSVHLELHFNICENMADIDALLGRVWEFVTPVTDCEYHETPAFFAYHHIAHMKYHFISGGCGIRPFLDLYVMQKSRFYDEDALTELLDTVGLRAFYSAVSEVVRVWFGGEPETALTRKCEEYILRGGVYGNTDNGNAARASVRNGRLRSAWHVVFPGYVTMCCLYPRLKKAKILLPFCYVHRICRKAFGKDSKRVRRKMKNIVTQDKGRIQSVDELLMAMGLKEDGET